MSFTNRMGLAAAVITCAATFGCGGGEKPAAQAPPATMAPAATRAPATMPTVTAGDFGVPECDAYMKKYLACVEGKVPEAQRAMMRQQLDQTKMAWQQAAATPQGKSGLAMGCTQVDRQS